uniref:cyclin-dependent kinase n=1 Tax=Heterorhabditis bacteriophora TaxID=37862 RepID=A0A1I7XU81_HETBA
MSFSPSSSPEERERKRERRNSDGKNRKKDKGLLIYTIILLNCEFTNECYLEIKDDHQLRIEGSTTELLSDSAAEFVPYKNEDTVEENVITSFTLDSPAGPKKYSKFDSSPEGGEEDLTPVHSDVGYSDVDEEPDEIDFDPQEVIYEQLTDEQKALVIITIIIINITLSPETKKRLEDEWQKRLISQLPVFYPGIMGCRNVAEFDCVNRVEEGTFGVVYRAKDKRTDEIVALKRLKMEKEKEGFPITALREINMLLKAGHHKNIVNVSYFFKLLCRNWNFVYFRWFLSYCIQFILGEQKTLMMQLLSGLEHMHGLWILHRDLKTSNLLMSHKGILKIADFGLAREYGDPLKPYTAVVVTLWYRSPELLLGQKIYSTPIDLWSVGCIMAEFMLLKPLFPGSGEIDQINKIFIELGTPSEKIWEGYNELPGPKTMTFAEYPYNQLRKKFPAAMINETGFKLLNKFLTYDPERRITAAEALKHPWFTEDPQPTPSEMFPTFPAKSEQHKAPPKIEKQSEKKVEVVSVYFSRYMIYNSQNPEKAKLFADLNVRPEQMTSGTFALKFDRAPF